MKPPAECTSLADVRAEIDQIDQQIITLLGQRLGYVQAAAAFKPNTAAVAAPERVTIMMEQRRRWAKEHGLDPDVIERMYRDLVAYFIATEQQHVRSS